jgi:hypothetical protein
LNRRLLIGVLVTGALMAPGRASAALIGSLEQVSPTATSYALGVGADFLPMVRSGLGDVTAPLQAVDLVLPPPLTGVSTSGCEAADFTGFVTGNIALLQRGACRFFEKAANAVAAGAVGVIVFNEGQPGRTEAIGVDAGFLQPIPMIFTSFALGQELARQLEAGQVVMRLSVTDNRSPVPEPATAALVAVGLMGAVRRLRFRAGPRAPGSAPTPGSSGPEGRRLSVVRASAVVAAVAATMFTSANAQAAHILDTTPTSTVGRLLQGPLVGTIADVDQAMQFATGPAVTLTDIAVGLGVGSAGPIDFQI